MTEKRRTVYCEVSKVNSRGVTFSTEAQVKAVEEAWNTNGQCPIILLNQEELKASSEGKLQSVFDEWKEHTIQISHISSN